MMISKLQLVCSTYILLNLSAVSTKCEVEKILAKFNERNEPIITITATRDFCHFTQLILSQLFKLARVQ